MIERTAGAGDKEPRYRGFLEQVATRSPAAVAFGRAQAVSHYIGMTGSGKEEAEAFYDTVKAACSSPKVVLNMSGRAFSEFVEAGSYSPRMEEGGLRERFNLQARKRTDSERALGCLGLNPTYASVMLRPEGDMSYGAYAVQVRGLEDSAAYICGDSFRIRSPARPDYVEEPSLILYDRAGLPDCKAAATILAMGPADLSGGPARALQTVMEGQTEFGRCEALIFAPVSFRNAAIVVASNGEGAREARRSLMKRGTVMPIYVSNGAIRISSPADLDPEDNPPRKPEAQQKHFVPGDRVILKPMASHPRILGTVIGIDQSGITTQWDDGTRSVYDVVEALMRIMAAPEVPKQAHSPVVTYSMPGMDGETVERLSSAGIDPVTVYSVASCHRPPSKAAEGWKEPLLESLAKVGLIARPVKGFVHADDGEDAFAEHEWIEARLYDGSRLVVDVTPQGVRIVSGEADDYIVPQDFPEIEIE